LPRPLRRILMISTHGYVAAEPELGRPDTGGQVVYVLRLSESLARLGYRVDIMTRRFEGQSPIEIVTDRVRIVRIPAGGPDLIRKEWMVDVMPEWIDNAARFVRAKGLSYDFINSHYWDAGLAGDGLSQRLGIGHIHTPHSIGSWKRDNMAGDPAELERAYNFRRRIRDERSIYQAADALIATTPQQRAILSDGEYDVPADRIAVVPPGYDDTRFYPVSAATRQAMKRDHGIQGPTILALGRVAANKGYDLLLRSLPTVFSRVPAARLMLAAGSTEPTPGEARQVDELRQLAAELGIADRVLFRDYIPEDQLADTYRMADVFALSSRYEPFGMTAIEAMACGTPSVITTEGGLWEMVAWGVEALYANPLDTEAFGHALATVLLYPKVAGQLAQFGSQRARSSFTWNGIAQRLVNLPQLIAVDGRARPAGALARATALEPETATHARETRSLEWIPAASS
jgi:mannosylfructose-phosphate synthase